MTTRTRLLLAFVLLPIMAGGWAVAEEAGAMKSTSPADAAPVFEHGDGRGSVGAGVKTPAIFLSRDEAMEIIKSDLVQAGLKFSDRDVELREVLIPKRMDDLRKTDKGWEEGVAEVAGQTAVLTADLVDARKKVAVVCVTKDNYFKLGGTQAVLPFQFYDFKHTAEFIAGHVADAGKGVYFGVFYDPMAKPESQLSTGEKDPKKSETLELATREKSRKLLHEQVKDFAKWLKEQGVLQ